MRLRFALLTLLVVIAALPAGSALGTSANPADKLADQPIDDYAYDKARDCRKRPTPGALALVDWLESNAQGTSWGIMRCERWGKNSASLHAEGRAVDWHLDAARPADRREARRLIDLWLATDRAGNEHALARRMGIQEIIWNCHSWWSGSDGMGKYSACYTERGRLRKHVDYTEAHKDQFTSGCRGRGRVSGRRSGRARPQGACVGGRGSCRHHPRVLRRPASPGNLWDVAEVEGDVVDASGRFRRALNALSRFDGQDGVVRAARALRTRLPGDDAYGDPLSVAGDEPPQLIGQRLAAATDRRPSAVRELGLGAIQVWQAVSEAQGRGRGDEPLAILFTDLVGFSDWALAAGDDAALELLRKVGRTVDPLIKDRDGRIVKRLGDGVMAVFDDAGAAVDAALEASRAVCEIQVDGYRPELRGGIHFGRPRKLGSDYFGVDVNVAARVADAAGPGEVLISEAVCEQIGDSDVDLRRRWRFKAKGTPSDLKVFSAKLDP